MTHAEDFPSQHVVTVTFSRQKKKTLFPSLMVSQWVYVFVTFHYNLLLWHEINVQTCWCRTDVDTHAGRARAHTSNETVGHIDSNLSSHPIYFYCSCLTCHEFEGEVSRRQHDHNAALLIGDQLHVLCDEALVPPTLTFWRSDKI